MIEAILKGLAMGLLLALSVGPVIFTVIKQSINNGHRGGFSFIEGVWLSDILLVVLSNAFSEMVNQLLEFKKVIGAGGSIFLMGMGIFFIFFKKIHLSPEDNPVPVLRKRDHARIMLSGFLLNTLNPAVIIFWLTSATAFAITHTFRQRIIIFAVCLGVNITADIFKVMAANRIRNKLTLHNIRIINKISGTILFVFGVVLFLGILFFNKYGN